MHTLCRVAHRFLRTSAGRAFEAYIWFVDYLLLSAEELLFGNLVLSPNSIVSSSSGILLIKNDSNYMFEDYCTVTDGCPKAISHTRHDAKAVEPRAEAYHKDSEYLCHDDFQKDFTSSELSDCYRRYRRYVKGQKHVRTIRYGHNVLVNAFTPFPNLAQLSFLPNDLVFRNNLVGG